ncbi:MAG: hypothetical protein LBK40_04855 [Spirochaetaceae bacterium]|jgi:hypothetical protein|nr:hypothetical protein [Spirochaetaceae bacterium]
MSASGKKFFPPGAALLSAPVVPLVVLLAILAGGGRVFPQDLAGDAPYTIPRNVYVGDQARLVAPLGSGFASGLAGAAGSAGWTAELETELPSDADVAILGLELERRGEQFRLNIDFAAYRTGWVEFPPVLAGGQRITGLGAEIRSILETGEEGRLLSPTAGALPLPGTVIMVYGFVAGALVFIIAAALLALALVRNGDALGRRFRKKKALRVMRKTLRRLKERLGKGSFSPLLGGELLERLSLALRRFLSTVLEVNCLSLVPGEFSGLDFERAGDSLYVEARLDFLASFFSRSDSLRFGFGMDRSGVASLVEEALAFITAFEKYRPPLPQKETAKKAAPGGRP